MSAFTKPAKSDNFSQAIDQAMSKLQAEQQSGLGFADGEADAQSDGYCSDANMTCEIMGEGTESRTLSGVDFDEWMQAHAVLEEEMGDKDGDDEDYGDNDEDGEGSGDESLDVQSAWESAQKAWKAGSAEHQFDTKEDEPVYIDLSDDEDDDDKIVDFDAATAGQFADDTMEDVDTAIDAVAATNAMTLLVSAMEKKGYQRPPLPPADDDEQALGPMARVIIESLERSIVIAGEVATFCDEVVAEKCASDAGTQTADCTVDASTQMEGAVDAGTQTDATYVEPQLDNSYISLAAELKSQIDALTAQVAQVTAENTELRSQLDDTKLALDAAHSSNAELADKCAGLERDGNADKQRRQELESANAELVQQCAALKAQLAKAKSRERLLNCTNCTLEAQLLLAEQKLEAHAPATEMLLEQQRNCDAQLVKARREARCALEQLLSAEKDLSNERRNNEVLRKRLREAVSNSSSPVRGSKRRRFRELANDEETLLEIDDMILSAGERARARRRSPSRSPHTAPAVEESKP
ncbi:hypothetical protein IWW51_005097, partial [Coemansia sp. RSA 2702]